MKSSCLIVLISLVISEALAQNGYAIPSSGNRGYGYNNAGYGYGNARNNYPNLGNSYQGRYVYRPCPTFDLTCIGEYLSRYSSCRIPNPEATQEPFYVDTRTLELPSINVTLIRKGLQFSNILSGVIEEFYVDYVNGYTVLTVDYTDLTIDIAEARYETNRRANIPLIEVTPVYIVYPQAAITTVFPSTNRLDLTNTRDTGFLGSLPIIEAQVYGQALTAENERLDSVTAEAFITTAPITNRFFIQSLICDYGIQPNQLGTGN